MIDGAFQITTDWWSACARQMLLKTRTIEDKQVTRTAKRLPADLISAKNSIASDRISPLDSGMSIPSATDITRDLVRFNTINPPGHEKLCSDYLGALLLDAGFEVDSYQYGDERISLVARLAGTGGKKPICFGGHTDVVPLGNQAWSVEPFAGDIVDGRIYGRGTCDMKSGVAAFVHMGLRLAAEPRGAADIVLVMVAGEETGCDGSKHLQDLGVLPEAGAMVIAEPTSNYPVLGHRGALWLNVTAHGKTAHGSMPQLGDNAVYKAARAVSKLENFGFNVPPDSLLGSTTHNVGTFHGGININSVPDRASFTIDIRSIPGHRHDEIIADLARYLGGDVEIETVVDVAPVLTKADDPWVRDVFELMTPRLGTAPESRGAPYFTDASALTPACGNPPTLILGPGDMALAHQTDEYCDVAMIEDAAEIYETIARRWCEA